MNEIMTFEHLLNVEYKRETVINIKEVLGSNYEPNRVWMTPRAMHNYIATIVFPIFKKSVRKMHLDNENADIHVILLGLDARYGYESKQLLIPLAVRIILGKENFEKYRNYHPNEHVVLDRKDPNYWKKRKFLQQLRVEAKRVEKTFKNI